LTNAPSRTYYFKPDAAFAMRINRRIMTARAVTIPTISQIRVTSVLDQPVVFKHSEVAIPRTT